MFNLRKLCTAAVLALSAALPTAAMAAENDVYFYSTAEASEKYIHNNIFYDFNTAAGGFKNGNKYNNNTGVGALSKSSLTLPDEGIIVIVARTGNINTDALDKIKTGMSSNPNLKFIIISESGGKENAQKFGNYIASDILHWPEASITHLPSSNYAAVPLDTNSYFATHFTGINAGLDTDPFGSDAHVGYYYDDEDNRVDGDEDEVHVHTYGVMECIPDKDRIFSYSQTRCQRTRGSTTTTDSSYYTARDCFVINDSNIGNLMEDIVDGTFLSRQRRTTGKDNCYDDNSCVAISASAASTDPNNLSKLLSNAQTRNTAYKTNHIDKLNPNNAAFSFAIPQWQSNYGRGACIMLIDDGNLLDAQGQDLRCLDGDGTCTTPDPTNVNHTDHAHDVFSHVNQRQYVAKKYLEAAKGAVCKQSPTTECAKWDITQTPTHKCELLQPSANTAAADIDINKGGAKCNTPAMWCDSKKENRKDYCTSTEDSDKVCCKVCEASKKAEICKAGEDPDKDCCTQKAAPPGGAAAVPTTGWPALLSLGVLLPLLARRRQRK